MWFIFIKENRTSAREMLKRYLEATKWMEDEIDMGVIDLLVDLIEEEKDFK